MTKKGLGSGWVCPPIVTCLSCMASRSALWTFAGARLISSARTRFAKIGPRWGLKSPDFGWKTMVPTTSLGSRSGVNWIRSNWTPSDDANDLTSKVLARPGIPSRSTWPPASRDTRSRSMTASWPMTALPISSRSFWDQAGPEDMLELGVRRWEGNPWREFGGTGPRRRENGSGLFEYFDRIADAEQARLHLVDEVLAEVDEGRLRQVAPVAREGPQGLGPARSGGLVRCRDDAAPARARRAQNDAADPDPAPGVLGVGFASRHDQIRAK